MPNESTAFAAIDIGTNTVRLLVTNGSGQVLARGLEITRLGEGVDQQSKLGEAAMTRTLAALGEFRKTIEAHPVLRCRAVATSAARDATNREQFFDCAQDTLGFRPELLSGEDEAQLSFSGAISGHQTGENGPPGPYAVLDIGGGSTEIASGTGSPSTFVSLNVGSVRLTERFLATDPPSAHELDAACAFVREQLRQVGNVEAQTWFAVAGTATTLAAYIQGLSHYEPSVTHGLRLLWGQVDRAFHDLRAIPASERRQRLIEPRRADVIVGGAAVLHTVMDYFGLSEIIASESDILDGIAASLRH